jgi:pyruvate-formate lyase-activating enzyme
MLAFYPRFIRTFDDLPGYVSLLIHSWNGCNMRCYGCHNYDELIAKKPVGHLTAGQVIDRLKDCHNLFDAVLISGGEFLMNEASEVDRFLQQVRVIFSGKIIVFTNGTYPRKLQRLLVNQFIDGVHVDMKLPFHCLDTVDDREVYEAIIGVAPSQQYCQDILESVETVIRHNSQVSQVRTVRYPLLSEEYFAQIRAYVNTIKIKYNSDVPYFLNPYHPPQTTS